MCGHFGIAGRGIVGQDLKALKSLGIVTQLRGLDGAGIYASGNSWANSKGFPTMRKSELDFCDLLSSDKDAISSCLVDVVIGHCRAATLGEVTLENCHPFEHGNLVVAHNGTLISDHFTPVGKETDSELMVKSMSEIGVHEALETLCTWDAFAIVGLDKSTNDLWFSRNSERPLHIAIHNKRDVMYWTSELGALDYVLERHNIKEYESFSFDVDFTFKTNIANIKAGKPDIFQKRGVTYSKAVWGNKQTGKKPGEKTEKTDLNVPWVDSPNNCCLCKSELTSNDWEHGLWSNRRQGWMCESCVQIGHNYG